MISADQENPGAGLPTDKQSMDDRISVSALLAGELESIESNERNRQLIYKLLPHYRDQEEDDTTSDQILSGSTSTSSGSSPDRAHAGYCNDVIRGATSKESALPQRDHSNTMRARQVEGADHSLTGAKGGGAEPPSTSKTGRGADYISHNLTSRGANSSSYSRKSRGAERSFHSGTTDSHPCVAVSMVAQTIIVITAPQRAVDLLGKGREGRPLRRWTHRTESS